MRYSTGREVAIKQLQKVSTEGWVVWLHEGGFVLYMRSQVTTFLSYSVGTYGWL